MPQEYYTLGIHIGHDRGASIVKNGVLFAHLAQDRLDRIKHSEFPDIPFETIDALLNYCGLKVTELAAVGVSYVNVEVDRFTPELKDIFCAYYNLQNIDFFGVSHHLAHALSTYYTSDFDRALLFIADGAGDAVGDKLEAESVFVADGEEIYEVEKRLHEVILDLPSRPFLYNYALMNETDRKKEISIAKKYEQFTNLLGFSHFQCGKTMGLSSYGRPMIDVRSYDFRGRGLSYSLRCQDLLDKIHDLKLASGLSYPDFVRRERANLASTVQAFVEHALIQIVADLRDRFNLENLCLAGGLFLNCVANHKLIEHALFKRVHIVPAAGDDGQSTGAAFGAYLQACGPPKRTSSSLPFLGLSHSSSSIRRSLENFNLKYRELEDLEMAQVLAMELGRGRVVGILRGRSEMGPHALCHRSILADSRRPDMKQHLNAHVKFREVFRPYAPVVTWEDQHKYFDLKQDSPFMLLAATVRPAYRDLLGAITHVDNTARVQAISREKDPFVHSLLREFEKLSGVPVLLNTSFNVAGEPIVETPHDAISTFLSTGIDVLALERFLVDKAQNTDRL